MSPKEKKREEKKDDTPNTRERIRHIDADCPTESFMVWNMKYIHHFFHVEIAYAFASPAIKQAWKWSDLWFISAGWGENPGRQNQAHGSAGFLGTDASELLGSTIPKWWKPQGWKRIDSCYYVNNRHCGKTPDIDYRTNFSWKTGSVSVRLVIMLLQRTFIIPCFSFSFSLLYCWTLLKDVCPFLSCQSWAMMQSKGVWRRWDQQCPCELLEWYVIGRGW